MDPALEKTLSDSYCYCFDVSFNEISIFLRNNPYVKTLQDVKKHLACCGGCQRCCPDVQKIVEFYRKET